MDKPIITVLLIISGVVCVGFIFNSVYPAITQGSHAVVSMANKIDDRMKSKVSIVHIASEYDPEDETWDDDADEDFEIFAWVKNVGTTRIRRPDRSDIFFGHEGNYQRIPYTDNTSGYPYWEYQIEGGQTEWKQANTVKVTIKYDSFSSSGLSSGTTYMLRMIMPNGISDESYLSL
ncbi:MAG: hypothetical protein ACLFVK_04255 [Dehalococcoidia bacterium]